MGELCLIRQDSTYVVWFCIYVMLVCVCVQKLSIICVFVCSIEGGWCSQHVISEWTVPPSNHSWSFEVQSLLESWGSFSIKCGHSQGPADWQTKHMTRMGGGGVKSHNSAVYSDLWMFFFSFHIRCKGVSSLQLHLYLLYFPSAVFCRNWAMKSNKCIRM